MAKTIQLLGSLLGAPRPKFSKALPPNPSPGALSLDPTGDRRTPDEQQPPKLQLLVLPLSMPLRHRHNNYRHLHRLKCLA